MAPEALKKNQYSHLSDIWAIGMIFYQFMTGHRPFYNKTEEYIEEKLNQSFIDRLLKNNSLSQVSR
jgi:serine/threonine protein kinase